MAYILVDSVVRSCHTMNILASDVKPKLRRTIRIDIDGSFFYTEQRGVEMEVFMIPIKVDKLKSATVGWSDTARLKSIMAGASDIMMMDSSPWVDQEVINYGN